MKKTLMFGLLGVALLAQGGVYDDCIFRFTGGKDVNGDGIIRQGTSVNQEFFNEMKAGVTNHATQFCVARGDATGIVFRTERVVLPCRPCETQDLQVLYFPQRRYMKDNGDGTVTTNFAPNALNFPFLKNLITNASYSAMFRIRRDPGYEHNRTVDFAAMGYKYPCGWILRIGGSDTNETRGVDLYTSKTATWSLNKKYFYFPTNMWVDIAVSVTNNQIRLALARPDMPVAITTVTTTTELDPVTNSSNAIGEWRFSNQADAPNSLINWNQTDGSNGHSYFYTTFPFHGSLQQIAYWNRTLSDDEIFEALGDPRPDLVRIGVGNDSSDEFGASRTSSTQTFDAQKFTLRNNTSTMAAGDAWTVSFNVLASESDLSQVFTVRTTSGSSECMMKLTVNGQVIGSRVVQAGRDQRLFVPAAAIRTGANQLVLSRVDAGATSVTVDTFRLGGSWQAGKKDSSNTDMSGEQKMSVPFMSSADMGWKHWVSPLCTYLGGINYNSYCASNYVIHAWVDEEVAERCPSKFSFKSRRSDRGGTVPTKGTEYFDVLVNGVAFCRVPVNEASSGTWKDHAFDIPADTLHAGWNEFRFAATPSNTNYWLIDFYRFELFQWPNGTMLFVR